MSGSLVRPSRGERQDQSVYILSFERGLIKIGCGAVPLYRRAQIARAWKMDGRLVWSGRPHPRASVIELAAHRALKSCRVGRRELFRCTIQTAKAAISAASQEQDEWLKANPKWLEEHVAWRMKAVADYNAWYLATKRQTFASVLASYP